MKTASLFVFLTLAAHAQAIWPCEATPAIERELRNQSLTDPQIAFADRAAAFHELLRKYPEDVFVHRRYQDWLSGNNTLPQQEQQGNSGNRAEMAKDVLPMIEKMKP